MYNSDSRKVLTKVKTEWIKFRLSVYLQKRIKFISLNIKLLYLCGVFN